MSQADQVNEVDETIKMLKKNEGFDSFVLLRSDGIVIRWEGMQYPQALKYAANALSLVEKSASFTRDLLEPSENQLQSLRLKCFEFDKNTKHEVIISQIGTFLMLCIQKEVQPEAEEEAADAGAEEEK
jgi:dynein light chain roadblock-type